MNKLSALILGLSMVFGTAVFAASQKAPAKTDETTTTTPKVKKHHRKAKNHNK